jgi:hypothetical protein
MSGANLIPAVMWQQDKSSAESLLEDSIRPPLSPEAKLQVTCLW